MDEFKPTACMNCKILCDVPVYKLLLDVRMMKQIMEDQIYQQYNRSAM